MHKVKNADFEEYRKYREDLRNGRILTPDGLRMLCEANDLDPVKIGNYFLGKLRDFRIAGLIK